MDSTFPILFEHIRLDWGFFIYSLNQCFAKNGGFHLRKNMIDSYRSYTDLVQTVFRFKNARLMFFLLWTIFLSTIVSLSTENQVISNGML